METVSEFIYHVFYIAVVFGLGALIGKPLYTWASSKLPWAK